MRSLRRKKRMERKVFHCNWREKKMSIDAEWCAVLMIEICDYGGGRVGIQGVKNCKVIKTVTVEGKELQEMYCM